jgi:hypothetical protein
LSSLFECFLSLSELASLHDGLFVGLRSLETLSLFFNPLSCVIPKRL